MSGAYFSYALLAALATALLVAAFTDLRRREIDNELNLAIALASPLWWLAMGFSWVDVLFQIALAVVTFIFALILFATRQMGGGDVKLLTALALWFTPLSFIQLVVLMAIIGGGASVGMAAFNMKRVAGETVRNGLALFAALVWVWCACAMVFALATGRPVVSQGFLESIHALLPQTWLMVAAGGALALILILGFLHIVRRQKSRLPIPYGIAISAAGLWVLGEHTLQAVLIAGQAG